MTLDDFKAQMLREEGLLGKNQNSIIQHCRSGVWELEVPPDGLVWIECAGFDWIGSGKRMSRNTKNTPALSFFGWPLVKNPFCILSGSILFNEKLPKGLARRCLNPSGTLSFFF
jgi:hypothetical protein